ncbi:MULTISPECIES: 5'-3' exonuclease [unclassified Butyrivibrio]|uniref:5'-3' exonuclease n=1 Tax=unclassified Butyrivibrio TaxID=2639466 RepID=UPI0008E6AD7A|nr:MULTISPECIES: 5'-3' exonuclease H3TH domain-containing protein [unclassified Butyrivibrio]RKM60138.1 5'-3' exonuclease [Butyrivibrio sp. XB500-5]SFU54230.1 DNA polymerase-1 [Butyrivibrio sp. INlla21]
MANEKFILIDGSSMLVTNYYGNLPKAIMFEKDPEKKEKLYSQIMHNAKGQYTNAMFGMMRTILKIIDEQKPTHIMFAFDMTRDTFRREKYAEYKANRGDTPEPLKEQFVNMENMLKEMGFKVLFDENYEADDIVGSVAGRYEKDIPMYIITKDHDYLQLVTDHTRVWLIQTKQETANELQTKYGAEYGWDSKLAAIPDKAFEVTPDLCLKEYGVRPDQIPDLKGIQGDSSDNIPGVKGVSSAALPLLAEYGTVEGIYEAIDDCKDDKEQKELAKKWKEELGISRSPLKALIEYRDLAILSKDLAEIRKDYPFDISLDDFKLNFDKTKAKEQFEIYGFKSLLDKIGV